MELVLIPCSGRKRDGGTDLCEEPAIKTELSASSWDRLLACRHELADSMGLAPGPDIGDPQSGQGVKYMPAYRRYDGNVYRAAFPGARRPSDGTIRIVVVSALYGLLDLGDSIRLYNLRMTYSLEGIGVVSRYWATHGLGSILSEAIRNLRPSRVHNLLSTHYLKAIAPWPPADVSPIVKAHRYPGLGQGSDFARGRDIASILASGASSDTA